MGQTVAIAAAMVLIHANRKIGGHFASKCAAQFFTLHFQKKKEFKDLILIFFARTFFSRVRYISRYITYYRTLYNLINHILLIFLFYR